MYEVHDAILEDQSERTYSVVESVRPDLKNLEPELFEQLIDEVQSMAGQTVFEASDGSCTWDELQLSGYNSI